MTTAEWVAKYNRCFKHADWVQGFHERWVGKNHLLPTILANPSHFDPHPGLDHQATDERALNQKETPIFTAPEDGYYLIGGYKTFCEAGMEVRAAVANIPDPCMSTDTEIKKLVPADEIL